MTARSCDECRHDGSWHYAIDAAGHVTQTRCPNWLATEQQEHAQQLAKLAHANAWEAAQQIISDAARELPVLDANLIRDRFEHAGVPSSLIGSAFTWAAKKRLIVKEPGRGQSTEASTRHEIARWRSLAHGQAVS